MGWILSKFRKKKSTLEVPFLLLATTVQIFVRSHFFQELEKIETELTSLGKLKTETLVWQKKV